MKLLAILLITFTLSACSNNTSNTSENASSGVKNTETGTVLNVRSIYLKPERLRPSIGISVGSGGYRGAYGGIDVGNVARVIKDANKPRFEQTIIVKTSDGNTAEITQVSREMFKRGDKVKVVLQRGEARVIH